MKTRIIDIFGEPSPKNVDHTWDKFANLLLLAFGELSRQNGFLSEEIQQLYCQQRLRPLDEKMLDSIVFNVPPGFIDEKEMFLRDGEKSEDN